MFRAPRNRISKKGSDGTIEGFGPQLRAKCDVVDDLRVWSRSFNLTGNSETFYEVVNLERHQPMVSSSLRVILDGWLVCCKLMVASEIAKERSASEQSSPADPSLI